MLLGTRRYQVGSDRGFLIADAIGSRRYQVGSDGGFSIADAARNGKYKTEGTLVVDLRLRGWRPVSGAKYGYWIFWANIGPSFGSS